MHNFDLTTLILTLPGIILGLTVHEFAHAYVAYLCGDHTARDLGRVTFNPLKHIDPLGFIFIIFAGFGWAKPVTFNESRLKNPETDVIKIAVAGPLSNALLAIILSGLLVFVVNNISQTNLGNYLFFIQMILYGIYINWGLFIFNLIPIPPLDGSHVFLHKYRNYPIYSDIYKYGTIGLFAILIIQSQTSINILPIGVLIKFLSQLFLRLFGYS